MVKLEKHERLSVTGRIEKTLNNYCRAGCPFSTSNGGPHRVCKTCPIGVKLRDYGEQIGFVDFEQGKKRHWTREEEKYLLASYGKIPTIEIANKLNRTYASVYRKNKKMEEAREGSHEGKSIQL